MSILHTHYHRCRSDTAIKTEAKTASVIVLIVIHPSLLIVGCNKLSTSDSAYITLPFSPSTWAILPVVRQSWVVRSLTLSLLQAPVGDVPLTTREPSRHSSKSLNAVDQQMNFVTLSLLFMISS